MARTPEGRVKEAVIKIVKEYGAYYFFPIGGAYSKIGVPDIIICYQGQFIGIECKAGKNTPTALQERELRLINDAGGVAMLINENNIEAVRTAFEGIKTTCKSSH